MLARMANLLVVLGIVLMMLSIVFFMFESFKDAGTGTVSGGGCIILFFIPICFGFGEHSTELLFISLLLALALTVILLITMFSTYKRPSWRQDL
ncbi:protein of unknown function DUF131 [Desulfurococcus amylolyticus DSM 16532]|uniref:DUF131 domain-containing protein n=1 Tax=Desulfurococcus amylolyticus DSM 16532 TaxID=768672 RepID=I3XRJ2_DESAM|nr:protein of unknown function DUF131 [Desulfurococcus amylolyticus DSM 16532]